MTSRVFGREVSRGQQLAEFAIVIPLFLAVFFGIAEGGYYVVATTIVNHATHEASRTGVLSSTKMAQACDSASPDQMPTVDQDGIRRKVKQAAIPIIRVACTDIKLTLKNPDGTIKTNDCDEACYAGRIAGERLLVETDYTHKPLVSLVFSSLTFPTQIQAELRIEAQAE